MKTDGKNMVTDMPVPPDVSLPANIPGLYGSLIRERLTYQKLTKKVKGKTVGYNESFACKSGKRPYSVAFTAEPAGQSQTKTVGLRRSQLSLGLASAASWDRPPGVHARRARGPPRPASDGLVALLRAAPRARTRSASARTGTTSAIPITIDCSSAIIRPAMVLVLQRGQPPVVRLVGVEGVDGGRGERQQDPEEPDQQLACSSCRARGPSRRAASGCGSARAECHQ